MPLSRRTALKSAGLVGAIGLSGCVGVNPLGGGTGNGSGNGSGGGGGGTIRVATAYAEDSPVPLAQQAFVENLQGETNGQIQVDLYPGGQLSSGPDLGSRVQGGSIEIGSLSYSNLSPYAKTVDIINLPYFAGEYGPFLNLITSDVWEEEVNSRLREQGFEPLFTWMSAPRAIGVREGSGGPITSLSDVQGMDIRIPASDLSEQTWNMAGANAVPVDWGETAQALQEGVVDGLHVSVPPLAAYGFQDTLASITVVNMVMDVGIYVASRQWYQNLSDDLQSSVDSAAEQTFQHQLENLISTLNEAQTVLSDAGVQTNELGSDELSNWQDQVGYQRSEWDSWKTDLAGDMETFNALEQATQQESDYSIPNYSGPSGSNGSNSSDGS